MPSDPSTSARHDPVTMALHWIIAAGVLALVVLGLWMIEIPKQPPGVRAYWFNVHKSIGLTVGVLVLVRLGWRLAHRPPPLPSSTPRWQVRAAGIAHVLLYACLVVMPLSGYLGSVFSGYPIRYFGAVLPAWGWKDEGLKELFSTLHYVTAITLIALGALHVMAALKHAFVDRDGVFERMLPHRRSGAASNRPVARRQGA